MTDQEDAPRASARRSSHALPASERRSRGLSAIARNITTTRWAMPGGIAAQERLMACRWHVAQRALARDQHHDPRLRKPGAVRSGLVAYHQ